MVFYAAFMLIMGVFIWGLHRQIAAPERIKNWFDYSLIGMIYASWFILLVKFPDFGLSPASQNLVFGFCVIILVAWLRNWRIFLEKTKSLPWFTGRHYISIGIGALVTTLAFQFTVIAG